MIRQDSGFGGYYYTSDLSKMRNCFAYTTYTVHISKTFRTKKNFRKPFPRATECARLFWVCATFFGCNRSNSNMRICVHSVKFFRVCAQWCEQTHSFVVFPTGAFVDAQSNSFVFACSPPNVLMYSFLIEKWHLCYFESFKRVFACVWSNSFVLALSS